MHRKVGSTFAVGSIAFALTVTAVPQAYAGKPVGTEPSGGQKGEAVYAQAAVISYDTSKNGTGASAGPVAATQTDWAPPPCWYAPQWTPEQLQKRYDSMYMAVVHDPGMPTDARGEFSEERRNYMQ